MEKYVFGVANAYLYDSNGDILLESKTLMDSSINSAIQNVDVRAGYGNPLRIVYFHSGELTFTLNDAQWNLNFLARTTGATISTGKNVYKEESVTLGGGGAGTVTGTPLAVTGSTIFGWLYLPSGITEKVTFTSQSFTSSLGAENDICTIRYYALDAAARSAKIPANFIPAIGRLVLEAQLFSTEDSSNRIGTVQFEFPRVQLSGSAQVSLTADGVSSTPMEARALAYTPAGETSQVFGYFNEIITDSNWYDTAAYIAIAGGDRSIAHPTTTAPLLVKVIHTDGTVSVPPYADIDFSSGTVGTATIGAHTGIITSVAAGTTLIKATVHDKPELDASFTLTVTS